MISKNVKTSCDLWSQITMSFLLNLILLPFEWLGRLIAFFLEVGWRFTTKFLISPWGLLLPCTLIAVVLLSNWLARNSTEIAESHLRSLETCEERNISALLEALSNLGESGIPALVRSLRQPREAVFVAARKKLNEELEHWENLNEASKLRRYRILSHALLEHGRSLDDEGLEAAIRWSRRMLRNLALSKESVQGNDATIVSRNCERLLSTIESKRKKMLDPNGPMNKPGAESIARLAEKDNGKAFEPTLMASMGRPFRRIETEEETPDGTPTGLATLREQRLQAYHESPQFRKQQATPYRRPGSVSLPFDRLEPTVEDSTRHGEMVATMNPTRRDHAPEVFPSDSQGKVAGIHPYGETANINRDYLDKNREPAQLRSNTAAVSDIEFFLPRDLRETPLERIPDLSSARLMRLLQHTDERYVSEARKTLIARDGFRDVHLKLAFRLFHPAPTVREELVSLLPNTTGVQPRVWLSVLLEDPNGDVRYRAASFLATTGDPSLQRLLIDRGKRDTDSRIVNLADRLQEQLRVNR